jgi:hypothetical protein
MPKSKKKCISRDLIKVTPNYFHSRRANSLRRNYRTFPQEFFLGCKSKLFELLKVDQHYAVVIIKKAALIHYEA